MKIYETSLLIDDLQRQTESLLQKAVSEWQIAAPFRLLQQPAKEKWSTVQCLEHLNSYGRYYLPAIEKAIEGASRGSLPSEQFRPGWLGNYFTEMMLPTRKNKKVKKMSAPKAHRPDADLNAEEVLDEFICQQKKLLSLLEKARTINLEKVKVSVSIAKFIKLKLGDTFRFLIAHNYRHVLQAERSLALAAKRKEERSLN